MKYAFAFLLLLIVLVSGCTSTQEQITCNGSYIKNGSSCCIDFDSNGICDGDEGKEYELCDAYDIINVTRTECRKGANNLPVIYLMKNTPDRVNIEAYHMTESGENLVAAVPDLKSGQETPIVVTTTFTEEVHVFRIEDKISGRCVYAAVDCS